MPADAPSKDERRESVIRRLVREAEANPKVDAEVDAIMRRHLGDASGLLPDERDRMHEIPGARPGSAPWSPGVKAKEAANAWLQEHVVNPAEKRGMGAVGSAVATVPMVAMDLVVPETVGELGMAGGPRVPKGAGKVVSLGERSQAIKARIEKAASLGSKPAASDDAITTAAENAIRWSADSRAFSKDSVHGLDQLIEAHGLSLQDRDAVVAKMSELIGHKVPLRGSSQGVMNPNITSDVADAIRAKAKELGEGSLPRAQRLDESRKVVERLNLIKKSED